MSRVILQTLLGLLFLAWLPACANASPESPFLLQLEETLSLSDLSDGGEPDWGEEGDFDALIPPRDVCCSRIGEIGGSVRPSAADTLSLATFMSRRHATGPPAI
ncbi:hypothetical protein [Microvirga solisilvae]|uniref:hypothetical protein n=1 Tax=Microvirga solisilvae TaxID=2919498 RepID=UPI001FAFBF37|nr:hypothetical protein [Microvirga solisilvae]